MKSKKNKDNANWLLLLLILLVSGSLYVELRRSNELVLDYMRQDHLISHQVETLKLARKEIEIQKRVIEVVVERADLLEKHLKEVHGEKSKTYAKK